MLVSLLFPVLSLLLLRGSLEDVFLPGFVLVLCEIVIQITKI